MVEGGVVYYVRTDHIGRPVFATDGSGAKVWEAMYLPFGEVLATSGTPIALRFPGQWFQAESGLHQNWMRDYDPTTGRYMQADPLGLVDGASVYGYARQNPGRYVDRKGEQLDLSSPLGVFCSITRYPLACMGSFAQRLLTPPPPQYCGPGSSSFDPDNSDTFLPPLAGMCEDCVGTTSNAPNCAEVRRDCHEACRDATEGENERFPAYRRCMRRCMESSGCAY